MLTSHLRRTFNTYKYLGLPEYRQIFWNSVCLHGQIQFDRISTMSHQLLKPPDQVRGMKDLNKALFNKEISVAHINLINQKVSTVLPHLKKYLLKMDKLKPIYTVDNRTVMLLNPALVTRWNDIDEDNRKALNKLCITEENFQIQSVTLTYQNFGADDILKSVLPPQYEGTSSFTKVGHIVQVNLREHLLDYKKLIGKVLLDKVAACRTVVNKTHEIDNTYRNFKMEVLSGDGEMLTEVRENNCRFAFDFSTVYWNSRLCTEHERIVKKIQTGDVLFDIFAGVGPFSIPAAKRKCSVYANDLNPESYKWLNHNCQLNKLDSNYIKTFNKDGHDFIVEDIKENLLRYINKRNVHITMNLPALAVEFLSDLLGLYNLDDLQEVSNPPIVYVYCFAKGEDYMSITRDLIFKNIGRDISEKIVDIVRIRTVSSLKEMMRVTFKLDGELLIKRNTGKRKCDDDKSVCKRSA